MGWHGYPILQPVPHPHIYPHVQDRAHVGHINRPVLPPPVGLVIQLGPALGYKSAELIRLTHLATSASTTT